MKFRRIVACLDMYGCPNRCRHCWIGHSPNGNLCLDDLKYVAAQFRPYADSFSIDDWYREPDYKEHYRESWDLCNALSDARQDHFELISVWRIVRDPEYVKWLAALGVKVAQLTLFGGREKTDYYTGRKNAYNEILQAIEILIDNKIAPRIQFFVNKDTVDELPHIEKLIADLDLENRCEAIGQKFCFFLHQGSCDGESEKLYDVWVTPEDLEKIPASLAERSLEHFGARSLQELFGRTEQSLYEELVNDHSTASFVTDEPVFYIDKDFNVYPNETAPSPAWCLGNLKTDGVEKALENYAESRSLAQHTRLTVPLSEIVRAEGDPSSQRLFGKSDYIMYLLNRYCRKKTSID